MSQAAAENTGGSSRRRPGYEPEKLSAEAIFALLDRAPFGRLATYTPPQGSEPGRSYVVPLQFVHREGGLLIITRPGRKVDALRAHPSGVCMQVDVTEGDGWTSICAWGNYTEVTNSSERVAAVFASFGKYPDRTTRQATSWVRQHVPGYRVLRPDQAKRDFVVGRIELSNVSGRYWAGLHLPPDSPILHGQGAGKEQRAAPRWLNGAQCRALLNSTPLARLAVYHPSRGRSYCLPFWYLVEGNELWLYHPAPAGEIAAALREHPGGVCLQADDLDSSPDADPAHPWTSVLADGRAEVYELGPGGDLAPQRQRDLLAAIRTRLLGYGIRSAFTPPVAPDPPQSGAGLLIRLRLERLSGQATG